MRRVAAVLGLAAVLAAGCTGGDGPPAAGPAAPATAVLGEDDPASGTPVRIGLLNVEGGAAASVPDMGDAAQAAADYANEHLGGVGGHPIEVVRCADRGDGGSAAACAAGFVRDGVAAVVAGQAATPDTAVPVLQEAGIPYVGAAPAAAAELRDDGAFFLSPGFLGLLGAQAVYAAEQGWATVTLFGPDTPQFVSAVDTVGRQLFQGQGVALRLVPVPPGAADATAEVSAGAAGDPDAVSVVADSTGCRAVLAALDERGSTTPTLVTDACVARPVLAAVGEDGVDGVVLFSAGDTGSDDDEETLLYRAVLDEYAPDADPGGVTGYGYLAMLGFVRAVDAGGPTGEVTPQWVRAALEAAVDVPLPIGRGATFSCDATAFPSPLIRATLCSSTVFVTTYDGLTPGTYATVDAAAALR